MRKTITLFTTAFLLTTVAVRAQETYKEVKPGNTVSVYQGKAFYQVAGFPQRFKSKKPRNIVLMIGDGMGVSAISAGMTANGGNLFLDNFRHIGLVKTQPAGNYITDSAAAGTALSTGTKTKNGAIAVDSGERILKTILEKAEERNLATGLVSTSAITHATPAAFIAHQGARRNYELIAADFLKTDIDVFIGGGYKHFAQRQDGRNLVDELRQNGYQVMRDMNEIRQVKSGKLAGLTAQEHTGRISARGDMLPVATATALDILGNNRKGFFLMVEGSQIDWGGHGKNTEYLMEEMLDFDRAIGKVLEFAARDGQTLVIVTADHETGGVAVSDGNPETGMVKCDYTTTDHTGVMVPLFAYGPGADRFTGIMDNTHVCHKINKLLFNE